MIIPCIIGAVVIVAYIIIIGMILAKTIDRRKKLKKAHKLSKKQVNRDLKRLNELLNLYYD